MMCSLACPSPEGLDICNLPCGALGLPKTWLARFITHGASSSRFLDMSVFKLNQDFQGKAEGLLLTTMKCLSPTHVTLKRVREPNPSLRKSPTREKLKKNTSNWYLWQDHEADNTNEVVILAGYTWWCSPAPAAPESASSSVARPGLALARPPIQSRPGSGPTVILRSRHTICHFRLAVPRVAGPLFCAIDWSATSVSSAKEGRSLGMTAHYFRAPINLLNFCHGQVHAH